MCRSSSLLVVAFLAAPLFAASNPIPLVNQPLVPSRVAPGSASFTLKLNGAGFAKTAVVNWNGVPLATTFVNHDRLKAFVPAGNVTEPSTATVTVTNPAPGGGTSNGVPFTITRPTASLTLATSTFAVGLMPAGVVVADFNNDGKADLAVINQNEADPACYQFGGVGTVSILLGNGDGTFSNKSTLCFPDFLGSAAGRRLVAGDFNGDGKTDLVASYYFEEGRSTLTIFLGNGDGTFTRAVDIGGDYDGEIGTVTTGDFNGDGKLDLAFPALPDEGFPVLQVLLGNGDGSFTSVFGFSSLSGDSLATGDFNKDGILDLAVTGTEQKVAILLGNGDGTFTEAATQPVTTLVSSQSVTTGDFNGDGILDLAFADSGSTALTVLLGQGDGTFIQKGGQPDAGQTTAFITTADFNGDGKLDLALIDSANAILIYLGNGDGTFQTALETAVGAGPSQLAFGDFNSDGRLDLGVANSGDNTITLILQSPAAILSRTNVHFGPWEVGTSSQPRRVMLTNKGSANLAIQSIVASGDFSETHNCVASLPIRRSCHIDVVFTPTKRGLRTGSITITDDAPDSPQVISLSGTGT